VRVGVWGGGWLWVIIYIISRYQSLPWTYKVSPGFGFRPCLIGKIFR